MIQISSFVCDTCGRGPLGQYAWGLLGYVPNILMFVIELYLSNLHVSLLKMLCNKPRKTNKSNTNGRSCEAGLIWKGDPKSVREEDFKNPPCRVMWPKQSRMVEQRVGLSFGLYAIIIVFYVNVFVHV